MAHAFPQAFPLLSGEKRPAVKWSDPAACSPSEAFTVTRYGLPTGPRNGIFVVDLDRKNGKDGLMALSIACAGRDLPDTYTVRTPSGGLHLYFEWDPEHPVGNPVGVLEGVDIRGDRGYVCAGGDYTVALDLPIAKAPEWLYEIIGTRTEMPSGESAVAIGPDHPEWGRRIQLAQQFVTTEPPCVSGQGGQKQLWKMALRLMRTYELPVDTAMQMLTPYNAICVPPWSEQELRRTLIRAAEEGQGPTGTFAADFMLRPAAVEAAFPAPVEDKPWRQVKNPDHKYLTDTASLRPSPGKKSMIDMSDLADHFKGPAAIEAWRGVWQFDEFRRRIIAVNAPFKLDAERSGLSEGDLADMRFWLECGGSKASANNIRDALLVAARAAAFHPVRDYLDGLPKMTVEEASAYFNGIAGRLWQATPERDALESGHVRRMAIAAVRRIREPGTKVDTMLVLAGEQGLFKSQFCSKLFGEYFLDQMPNLEKEKEASIAIEGYWGIEFAEFRALRASEATKKEFLTRQVDKYRPVWAAQVQEFRRQCVFIGTTNEDDFLTDPTGDTRYDICDVREPIKLDTLDRDAFWAAANALEATGEPHWRDRAERARNEKSAECAVAETASFHAEDVWTSAVLKYGPTVKPIDEGAHQGEKWVTAHAVINYGLVLPTEKQDGRVLARVKAILRRAYGASQVIWLDGRAQRAYKVPTPS